MLERVFRAAPEHVEEPRRSHLLAGAAAGVRHCHVVEKKRAKSMLSRPKREIDFLRIHEEAFIESTQPTKQLTTDEASSVEV
jgi:hypothetical protein